MSKKVYIKNFGCQMNFRDAEVIAGILQQAGFGIADSADLADVVIFVTCAVRQHAEDKVWSDIGRIAKMRLLRRPDRSVEAPHNDTVGLDCVLRLDRRIKSGNDKKNKPGGDKRKGIPIIGLVGCMAQEHKEKAFERSPDIDFVVGPADIGKIPEIVKQFLAFSSQSLAKEKRGQSPKSGDSTRSLFQRKIWETDGQVRPEGIYHTGFYNEKDHAYVVISEGCSNFCSYCVVPYVRGPLRHRNFEDILREIELAVGSGRHRITLLGQNVCAYGVENPGKSFGAGGKEKKRRVSFIDLLILVNGIKGLEEVGFITSHPKDTTIELFEAMEGLDKVKKYLHLPVQSGSDRILELMNRGYSRKYYLDLADNYRKIVKDGVLTTDVIVGFPGETKKDFEDTVDLVRRVEFDAGFIFKYSRRPFTSALDLKDDVSKEEKERRHVVILELQKKISTTIKNLKIKSQK